MTVKTFAKGLQVLEALTRRGNAVGVAELARELNMPKSNVFRLLNALVAQRYARKRPDDNRYELTLKLWELGAQVMSHVDLTNAAAPHLDELAARSGETTQLAVFDDCESVYIDKRDGRFPIRGFTKIGSRAPGHCCATGKAELAFKPVEVIARVGKRLERFTSATIATPEHLDRELKKIRTLGYATNRGEWFEEVWGVAAPIRNGAGGVCGSIGIWGPKERISKVVDRSAEAVTAAAARISAALGHSQLKSLTVKTHRSSR
jgi:IclR family KDG regulon transcriptional repressor